MKIQKQIITTKETDIDIKGITLLSLKEYESNKDLIQPNGSWWWLRSPGYSVYRAAFVDGAYGDVSAHGISVRGEFGVRPALQISESPELKAGDKVEVFDKEWTVLKDNLILCNENLCEMAFREDYRAKDANIYKKSDVKTCLDNWLKEKQAEYEQKIDKESDNKDEQSEQDYDDMGR